MIWKLRPVKRNHPPEKRKQPTAQRTNTSPTANPFALTFPFA